MSFRFRADRLIPIAIGLLLVAAAAVYYVLQHAQEMNVQVETDWLLLLVMSIVMALLALSLFAILLRNLIKLLVERRRKVLGSRFRTKLVFIFLVLVLLPSMVLFYAAIRLVQQVNETLFTEPLQVITADSKATVDEFHQVLRQDCLRFAARIAVESADDRLLAPDRSSDLGVRARRWLAEDGLDFVAIYGRGAQEPLFTSIAPDTRSKIPDADILRVDASFLSGVLEGGGPADRLDRVGTALRASALAPIVAPGNGEVVGAVHAGRFIPPAKAGRSARIDTAFKEYRRALKQRPEIRRVYIGLFATLTLLVTFAATWTGLYLARQITVPIQALAEGTQAISSGNLDYRVTAKAGDEIGDLIESFNRMTAELRSNREAIETSQQQLEASNLQLEERRAYIEQLLENVPAGVISLDARGILTTMNRAAYRILGLDPEVPCSGKPVGEAFRGETLLPLVHEIEDLPGGEIVSQVRDFQLELEGRPVNLAVNLSARRDGEGHFQGALVVIEDLTPVIRAQKTAAWREVARRIAHEIKNPLTPIQLSAQRILKKFQERAEDFPKIVEEGVHTIVDEVRTLKLLVDEFSRFARMPAVSPVPTDPNAVVEAAVALFEGIHAGITVEKDLDPSSPELPLDREQMKRALVNLMDNAISAMDGKGTITLTTRSIPEERIVRIEVADDGPGIGPEDKERLFVPYFSTKKRGTGLGLAIVNRIVSDHNGFIRVEDNRPRGTRFVIDLPA